MGFDFASQDNVSMTAVTLHLRTFCIRCVYRKVYTT